MHLTEVLQTRYQTLTASPVLTTLAMSTGMAISSWQFYYCQYEHKLIYTIDFKIGMCNLVTRVSMLKVVKGIFNLILCCPLC